MALGCVTVSERVMYLSAAHEASVSFFISSCSCFEKRHAAIVLLSRDSPVSTMAASMILESVDISKWYTRASQLYHPVPVHITMIDPMEQLGSRHTNTSGCAIPFISQVME